MWWKGLAGERPARDSARDSGSPSGPDALRCRRAHERSSCQAAPDQHGYAPRARRAVVRRWGRSEASPASLSQGQRARVVPAPGGTGRAAPPPAEGVVTPLDPEQARELGRRGAAARWAKPRPGEPFAGTFLDFMDLAGLMGDSWLPWRAHWKAVDGLPLTDAELALFRAHTGRQTPPAMPVREVWDVCGRRSGKTRGASARAFYEGIRRDYRQLLAPGERAVIPVIAADRKQAGQAFGYIARGLARLPEFAPYVARTLKESIELTTGVTVEVHTASYRTVRGYTVVALVADEMAFWMNLETGANPDTEVLAALRPGMATVPGALLIGVSTPYAARGEIFRAYERAFGKPDARTLVWVGDTASMNPALLELDPDGIV